MNSEKSEKKSLSRRDFLKGAVVAAGTGLIAGCSPKVINSNLVGTPTAQTSIEPAVGGVMNAATAAQKWSFEIPPGPIPDSQIANTVETEVVIVGSGPSGMVCAASAVENGAKVVVITASKGNISRGGSNYALNSKLLQKMNLNIPNTDRFFRKELAAAGYIVDQDKWWKFAKNSEEAMNWLIDVMEKAGFQTVLEKAYKDPNDGPMTAPTGSHSWVNDKMTMAGAGQQFVVDTLAKNIQAAGAQIIYKTVAKQLVRENNNTGRVTAVIAQGEDGKYTKYVGSKAIVLATGDFSADKEMMTKYCPQALSLFNLTGNQGYDTTLAMGGLFKGDGQKMGLWIGAAWQKTFPNAPMIAGGAGPATVVPSGNFQGLIINKKGYRYSNEDTFGAYEAIASIHQPEMQSFAIWDVNFAEAMAPWFPMGAKEGDAPTPPTDVVKGWDEMVKNKAYISGNTIEDLISQLGLPLAETKATIERYNQFCAKGVDEDYYKRKELLIPINTAPFYGSVGMPFLLTVTGGLRTNINMQVCDANDQPIPGLYNIGTMVGDYFANYYNFLIFGNNLGANCVTFGFMTGRDIAKGTSSL